MKKIFFLISLLSIGNITYASPFNTPSFRFIPAGKLQLYLKEIYIRENNFGLEDVEWRSNIETDFYYGINKDIELDLSFPYSSGGINKQSGLGDSLFFLKYRIFSSQGDLLADRDLDIALQLGGKVRTGEPAKDLRGQETDILCSLLGRYEIGRLKGDCFFYFHLGEWFPVEGDYKYRDTFQYDFALECQYSKKMYFFLEANGNRTTDYNLVYIGPGIQFRPGLDWEINFSVEGSISDPGGFFNTKTAVGVVHVF